MAPVRNVLVLDGGSAGLIAALTLQRKLPQMNVRVLRSPDIGVIGGWPRTNEPIKPDTVAETMDSGWGWQVEHENWINRGYALLIGQDVPHA